ncbi:hypothetical protein PDESU_00221 [Pontiella desulfatans]|uniref:Polymerase nucleotidyl transferase domain-containing protein n=1 Tax=Pontiella desulfatans TaxID=2750659 RepID=A0A6C2TWH2_PONDE|nr:nucleotidyltransferase domain-containing protein [Pontiella desulfatans]VGO11676.1 hypothetical protein PDESU_00221 [Pontiella desulfatans]
MIDLPQEQLETVRRILSGHVHGAEIRVFGSRVQGNAKPWSDLDLVIIGNKKLELGALGDLREAFEESDLPIRIDVLDWHSISSEFRKVIQARFELL